MKLKWIIKSKFRWSKTKTKKRKKEIVLMVVLVMANRRGGVNHFSFISFLFKCTKKVRKQWIFVVVVLFVIHLLKSGITVYIYIPCLSLSYRIYRHKIYTIITVVTKCIFLWIFLFVCLNTHYVLRLTKKFFEDHKWKMFTCNYVCI